jgi:hypothetical protein
MNKLLNIELGYSRICTYDTSNPSISSNMRMIVKRINKPQSNVSSIGPPFHVKASSYVSLLHVASLPPMQVDLPASQPSNLKRNEVSDH